MQEQMRITFQPFKRDIYMNETIKQQRNYNGWKVEVCGWTLSGVDVKIIHPEFIGGYAYYSNVKFKNSRHFAEFVTKMLKVFKYSFKKDVRIDGSDYLDLMRGYEKGVKESSNHYMY